MLRVENEPAGEGVEEYGSDGEGLRFVCTESDNRKAILP
jgi:hypothetical protein